MKKDHKRNQIYLKRAMDDVDYYKNKRTKYYNALYYERKQHIKIENKQEVDHFNEKNELEDKYKANLDKLEAHYTKEFEEANKINAKHEKEKDLMRLRAQRDILLATY